MNDSCCPICNNLLSRPASLPCGHRFCHQCIHTSWDDDERNNRPHNCPVCGAAIPSGPQLIENQSGQQHHSGAARYSCTVASGNTLCPTHNTHLNVYCFTDDCIICETCASLDHGEHTLGLVKVERRKKQEELMNMKTEYKTFLQEQEKRCENMMMHFKQIQEATREAGDFCDSVLARVIDSIQRHFQSLSELISSQEGVTTAQVQSSQQDLQLKMEEMRTREAALDRLAQTSNDVHFLQEWASLRHLWEEDRPLNTVSEDLPPPFENIKRAVEQLGGRLEVFCDKEFASISKTADSGEEHDLGEEAEEEDMQINEEAGFSGVTFPTVEPKTRADFLQYSWALTLDPTTAHEDLVLSEDHKEVRLCTQGSKNPGPRCPERFVYRRQVLCKEALQAPQRCYYEVEVEGEKAEIALTYKGIARRSLTGQSAFGGNTKSWSLDRSSRYSVSHRGDSVQLTTSPSCNRIGVYLDRIKGTISFYEVSGSMMFLYKVEATFTEPLYPGFWLGEESCIRICDLR